MRRGDNPGQLQQGTFQGRLVLEDIEGCSSHLPPENCFMKSFFIDQSSPGTVYQADSRFHHGQLFRSDKMVGLLVAGKVQGDEIGPA